MGGTTVSAGGEGRADFVAEPPGPESPGRESAGGEGDPDGAAERDAVGEPGAPVSAAGEVISMTGRGAGSGSLPIQLPMK